MMDSRRGPLSSTPVAEDGPRIVCWIRETHQMLAAEGAGRGKGFACLGPIHAMEGGDRFTRRRGDAEGKGHLDGESVCHCWVPRCRRRSICDRHLSLRSPRLRVRLPLHGHGLDGVWP